MVSGPAPDKSGSDGSHDFGSECQCVHPWSRVDAELERSLLQGFDELGPHRSTHNRGNE